MAGSLAVVGLGIQAGAQTTPEARFAIETADVVLYLATDLVATYWLHSLNPNSSSLAHHYVEGRDRYLSYLGMVDEIMSHVKMGKQTCAVSYGHPGVFSFPFHEVVRRCQVSGFPVRMQPAISAQDCLFADLGVDPGVFGCASFEATDFLVYRRIFDPTSHLILWQIGVLGETSFRQEYKARGIHILVERLASSYKVEHQVTLYQAPNHPIYRPVIVKLPLGELHDNNVPPISTLYIPPISTRPADGDVAQELGIDMIRKRPLPTAATSQPS